MRALLFFTALVALSTPSAARDSRLSLSREVAPFEPDELAGPVWNLDRRSTLDDHAAVFTRVGAGVYYEWAPDRCRAYALVGDTLVYRGYNIGRHERMILDSPAPSRLAGNAGCCDFHSAFTARGLLYDRFITNETGTIQAEARGQGYLVLGGDTVAVVLQREVIETVKFFGGDSSAVAERAEIYRWLPRGELHPLALQIKVDNETARLFAVDEDELRECRQESEYGTTAPGGGDVMAVLESAKAVHTALGIEVSFGQSADVPFDVNVYLIDTAGNIYASASASCDAACSLPLPPVWTGQLFVVVACASNPELRYKFFAGI